MYDGIELLFIFQDIFRGVLPVVFENHPSCAYQVTLWIPLLVLGAMFLFSPNPSRRGFAFFSILFVGMVEFRRVFRAIRNLGIRDFQSIEEGKLEADERW